jgi:inorganic pyrophosphatase
VVSFSNHKRDGIRIHESRCINGGIHPAWRRIFVVNESTTKPTASIHEAHEIRQNRRVLIHVFVQNEAGSTLKHLHDEKTLAHLGTRIVAHAYPFPYGFVIGTSSGDGCNVDCFVITQRPLSTGTIVDCEPLALMEQIEDGVEDHNIIARPAGEPSCALTPAVEAALMAHVLACFQDVPGKTMRVGRFLDARHAATHIAAHRVPVNHPFS